MSLEDRVTDACLVILMGCCAVLGVSLVAMVLTFMWRSVFA